MHLCDEQQSWACELFPWKIVFILFILDFIFCQGQISTIGNLSMLSFNREEGDGFILWQNLFFREWCFGPDCEDVGLPVVAQSHLNICIGIDPSDDKIVFPVPKMLPHSITVPPKCFSIGAAIQFYVLYICPTWPIGRTWKHHRVQHCQMTIRHQLIKKKEACFLWMWHHLKGK